jgi:hypothetical protein
VRSIFLEALFDRVRAEGLGIEAGCLQNLDALINRILADHAPALQDRDTFITAYADFGKLLSRMIADARAKGYSALHEDTLIVARQQCGLVFWCS